MSFQTSPKRDWKYMKDVLDNILVIWNQQPYLRLSQLLVNASGRNSNPPDFDIFSVEDDELIKDLHEFNDRYPSKV